MDAADTDDKPCEDMVVLNLPGGYDHLVKREAAMAMLSLLAQSQCLTSDWGDNKLPWAPKQIDGRPPQYTIHVLRPQDVAAILMKEAKT